jgi:CRP-like cAMP-binding protein
VPFVRQASDECVVDICREFRGMPALAGDEIVVKGEHNHELIILEYGEAVGKDGTLATRYKAGSFFGEMEFLGLSEGSLSQTTVTAITDCDLYTLRFGDIGHVLMEFPEMQHQLTQYAALRIQATNAQGGQTKVKDRTAAAEPVVDTIQIGTNHVIQSQEFTYDVASASEELDRCSKADLQAAVLRSVLTGRISMNDLRDL